MPRRRSQYQRARRPSCLRGRLAARGVAVALLWACLGLVTTPARALDPVTLQLKWTHAFQFAGYYAAQAKGYYRDAGLDLQIVEARPSDDPMRRVVDGTATFGVGTSSIILARYAGEPVVVLGVVFQHSPQVLLVAYGERPPAVHDLVDQRVMIEPQSQELFAYLRREGVPAERIERVEHTFSVDDLVAGRVSAMSAYSTSETYFLERRGFKFEMLSPRSAGIDFYGDNLFTSERELTEHPDRTRAFRDASMKGWAYAMRHPAEIIDWMLEHFPKSGLSKEFLEFEAAQMAPLLRTDLIEPGYMYRGRWQHIAETYAELNLLPSDFSLDGLLYEPDRPTDRTWYYVAGAAVLLLGLATLTMHRINTRLNAALLTSRRAEEQMRQMAQRDSLTGLPNRALFGDRLEQAMALAHRHKHTLAVMFVDLDDFKPINDTWGHAVGDEVLVEASRRMQAAARESDTVARIGGDEFLVLLPVVSGADGVRELAERVRASLERPFLGGGRPLALSCSIGAAVDCGQAPSAIAIIARADDAMYAAKQGGRNAVVVVDCEPPAPADASAPPRGA